MPQYLPYSNFKWMNEKEINKFNLALVKENAPNGYIFRSRS